MRILTIYQTNEGGGCFKRLCDMMNATLNEGWEVHYISTAKFPLYHPNLYFHKLPRIFRQKFLFYFYFLFVSQLYIIYLTMKHKLNIFVVFGSSYAFSCSLAKLIFNTPLITFIHGDWIQELSSKNRPKQLIQLGIYIEKIGLSHSDKIYTVSHDLRNRIIARYNSNKEIEVLYNNIDTSSFFPRETKSIITKEFDIPTAKFLIGFVGPMSPIKKIDILIEAYANISYEKCRLMIVGSGQEEKKLKKLVSELGIDNDVIFTGWRDDIPEIMSALDLLVLPSEYEGCPMVLLEGLGCDTPCIGSDVGGITEILKHGELLFAPLNVNELKDKLELFMNNEGYYNKIKSLCLKRKNNFVFDWDGEVTKIINQVIIGE